MDPELVRSSSSSLSRTSPTCSTCGCGSRSVWRILSGDLVCLAFPKGSDYLCAFSVSVLTLCNGIKFTRVLINLFSSIGSSPPPTAPASWSSPARPRSSSQNLADSQNKPWTDPGDQSKPVVIYRLSEDSQNQTQDF